MNIFIIFGYLYNPIRYCFKIYIKFLFEECDAEVVYAEYMSNNIGSGKVMAKAGMKFEGFLRNRIVDKDGIRISTKDNVVLVKKFKCQERKECLYLNI